MRNFLSLSFSFLVLLSLLSGTSASAQCPVQASVDIKTHTDITCFGANDGTITVDLADASTSEPFNFELYDLTQGAFVTLTVTETENKPNRSVVYSDVPPSSYAVLFFKAGCPTLTITETVLGTVLIEPAQLGISATVDPDCGAGNGQIDIVVSGGTLPYSSIIWSGPTAIPNGTTSTAANLTAGVYTVTVTDANGCTFPQNINVPITTIADAGASAALVCGPNTFNLSANAAGPGEIGTWSGVGVSFSDPNDPNATVTGLTVGANVLTWTIQDIAMVCLGNSDNITVTYSDVQMAGTPDVLLDCFGDTDGTGTFIVTGGVANFTYSAISNTAGATIVLPPVGPTTSVPFTNAGVGVVTLQVQDATGCTSQSTITINQPAALSASVTTITNVLCNGGATGAIDITVGGGTPGYTYLWSNGATTEDVAGLIAGTYSVTITDANSCTTSLLNINVSQPAAITASVTTITNVLCNGGATGAIDITAGGGTPGYTYLWSNGATTEDVAGLIAGTYSVTITDANSCTTSLLNINVSQPAAITASVTTITNVLCNGGATGAIDIAVGGGAPGYTYLWSNGATTQDVSGLTAGTYSVTITDANLCTTSLLNINVTQPTAISASVTTITNVLCNGGATGAIDIAVGGGAPGYTYLWSNGATTQDVSGLAAGTYSVTITDANLCTTSLLNINVTQPTAISASVTTITNVLCNGAATGAIDIAVGGGTPGYTYLWSNGATTQDVSGLAAGTYSVTITDANLCTTSLLNINVTQPTAISASVTTITNVLCNGAATGAIDIAAGGGTPGYTYLWSNGATTEDVAGLIAGTYSVTITDANLCTTSLLNINVTQPTAISASVTTITNVLCNGAATGAIDIAVGGGTPGYTYLWSNGATTQDVSGLAAGTYSVTITDANLCTTSLLNINVTQPTAISASVTTITNVLCNGGATGAIDIAVGGGAPGYTYLWSNGATTQDVSGLTAGTYSVTITDANLCTTSLLNINVSQPAAITASVTTITNVLCNGGATGAIDITVGGGTPGYTYLWSNGATTQDVAGLIVGTYSVTITDANSCSVSANNIAITEPTAVVINSTSKTDATCLGVNDGNIQVNSVSGGTPGYQYSIDNGATFQASNTFPNLPPAAYQVVVRDQNSCVSAATLVTVNAGVSVAITGTSQTDATCAGINDGSITISSVSGGTGPYQYSIDNGATFQVSNIFTNLAVASYQVIAMDAGGCQSPVTVVSINSALTITFTATPVDATCLGINDGSISITGESGGTAPYTYSIDGVTFGASPNFTALPPNIYSVSIQDVNGCLSGTTSVSINNGTTISITAINTTDATCAGISDGTIDVITVSGGTAPYEYSIDAGVSYQVATLFSGLAVSSYDVVVKDANGCESSISTVNINPALIISGTITTTDASCGGASDGSITIATVSGGLAPYNYSIDNGLTFQASNNFPGIPAATYDVVIEDSNGCLSIAQVITVNNALSITPIIVKNDATCAGNDGSIVITSVSGGTGPFQYSINNGISFQASNSFSNLTPATYQVIVQDANGCFSVAISTSVTVPGGCPGLNCFAYTILVDPILTQRPSCASQDDGVIAINVTGITPGNYIIQILKPSDPLFVALTQVGPSGTYSFNGLSPGNYQYSILDQVGNLCSQPYSLPIQTNVDADASGLVDATCFGQPTGQATLTVNSGGNSPYEYSLDGITWISFTSPFTITNLPPNGTYSILVRDDASDACPDQVPVTINAINPQINQPFTVTPATCNNNDGIITLTAPASGGAGGPYTFLIDGIPTAPVANEFTGLSGGNRTLSVIDNGGCQRDYSVPIIFPGFVNTSLPTISGPDCISNGTNGVIAFTILDVGSFEFAITTDPLFVPSDLDYITTGGPNVIIPNLTNGGYFVWLRSLGSQCPTKLGPLTVIGVYGVSFLASAENELCFGDGGSIVLSSIVGAPNLDYGLEINGTITNTIDFITSLNGFTEAGLAPGSYQVRLIQDQTALNGCTVSTAFQPFTIDGPSAALGITSVTPTLSFPDQPTGTLQIVIQESGEEGYEVWLTSDDFNSDTLLAVRNPILFAAGFSNLAATDYVLHLKDALGCEITQDVSIAIDPTVFVPNIFTPNNDGVNDEFYVRNLPASGSKLSITNRWGTEVYSSGNYNPDNLWNGGDSPDGIYYYRLQIQGGKTYTGWVEIVRGVKP